MREFFVVDYVSYNGCMIVGIDEVGRGPWAGPLVFGAVVLGDAEIVGLTDSKKLTKKRREMLSQEIYEKARAVGLGWVSAAELDKLGMSEALRLACRRALGQITVPYQQIVLDGTINFLEGTGKGPYVTTLARADLLVPSVSAASIVAKVARDAYMTQQDDIYPGYGFGSHVGYGTAAHRIAIEKLGVTPLHRLSFAPLAHYASAENTGTPISKETTYSRDVGNRGEDSAAGYLRSSGFTIIDRNWRVKAGEIDIIAEKDGVIHFVEVKYRKNKNQGGGIAAITPTKLGRMERAARLWMQRHGDHVSRLSAIEVTGNGYEVTQFLEQV
jgi:ribonuclease HII